MNQRHQVAKLSTLPTCTLLAATAMLGGCVGDVHDDDAQEMRTESEVVQDKTTQQTVWTTWISVKKPQLSPRETKVMDVVNGSGANGARVQLWDQSGVSQQDWIVFNPGTNPDGPFEIINDRSRKCLDMAIDGPIGNGTRVQQWECSKASNQQWRAGRFSDSFSAWVELRNMRDPSLCLDVTNVNYANGALLQVWKCSGAWNQRWNIFQ